MSLKVQIISNLGDPNRVDPIKIAKKALPDPEYVIEKVLKHKPENFNNKTKREDLFFLIQWENFGEEHNSWEPWSNLRRVGIVHEYLKINKMKFLIPRNIKD